MVDSSHIRRGQHEHVDQMLAVAVSQHGDARNREYSHHLDTLRERNKLLDAAETTALTGSRYFTTALYTPGTVMLQPAAYVQALADGLLD